jgi:hypothetical protein
MEREISGVISSTDQKLESFITESIKAEDSPTFSILWRAFIEMTLSNPESGFVSRIGSRRCLKNIAKRTQDQKRDALIANQWRVIAVSSD